MTFPSFFVFDVRSRAVVCSQLPKMSITSDPSAPFSSCTSTNPPDDQDLSEGQESNIKTDDSSLKLFQFQRPGVPSGSGEGSYLHIPGKVTPTPTIVVLDNNNSPAAGTSTQTYSNNPSPMSGASGDLLYQRQPLLQNCENGGPHGSDGGLPLEISSEAGTV